MGLFDQMMQRQGGVPQNAQGQPPQGAPPLGVISGNPQRPGVAPPVQAAPAPNPQMPPAQLMPQQQAIAPTAAANPMMM